MAARAKQQQTGFTNLGLFLTFLLIAVSGLPIVRTLLVPCTRFCTGGILYCTGLDQCNTTRDSSCLRPVWNLQKTSVVSPAPPSEFAECLSTPVQHRHPRLQNQRAFLILRTCYHRLPDRCINLSVLLKDPLQ